MTVAVIPSSGAYGTTFPSEGEGYQRTVFSFFSRRMGFKIVRFDLRKKSFIVYPRVSLNHRRINQEGTARRAVTGKGSHMKLNVQNASLRATCGDARQFPREAIPQVAFAGRSNVGKSSLVNSLLNRKSLARVSGTPGKTITVNFYDVDKKLYLVDLPGYGFAKRDKSEQAKWSALTDGFFTSNRNADLIRLVVQLVDSRIGPTEDDRNMLAYLAGCGIPHVVVGTKTDKLNATERRRFSEMISECEEAGASLAVIPFSAKTGEGRDELWHAILEACDLA